jgi:small-conductance mechanosensitive channel/CRP-like cAMP-binding protein
MTETSRFSRLKWPMMLLLLLAIPAFWWDGILLELGDSVISQTASVLRKTLLSALWMALAWVVVRVIDAVVWQGVVARRLRGKVPRLLKDVVATVIFLIAISGILGVVFKLDVTGLWATSGVVGLVVGFALQSMISDVFSGIALNIDRPFAIGDWIRLSNRAREHIIGEVIETNWRSTRIKCIDGTMVIVPNGWIATDIVTNLTNPTPRSRFSLFFCLDFGVPADRAMRILEAGVKSAAGVLKDPGPKVRVNGTNRYGVEYEVRYWLLPRETSPSKGRHRVATAVLDQLHRSGLTLAYEKHDVYTAAMPQRALDTSSDRSEIIHRVDLFALLETNELEQLAASVDVQQIKRGTNIVVSGDQGDSMYILVEGLLEVFAMVEGVEIEVGRIAPGQFFGEMSLLTGEPRSATVRCATEVVVFQVRKADLSPLLEARPALAKLITEKVAERRLRNDKRRRELNETEPTSKETQTLADQILGKMKSLFGF